ncbi:MAG: GNAT family N-acetyltransferase [Leptospiraceae bacterium]|nr:GNAT family N-acetyltransferase [Leptospiraceae bacterium]
MIHYKKLTKGDDEYFIDLIGLFEDVFEMQNFKMPEQEYLRKLLSKENFLVFVALLENKVIGGLTAYTLDQYYSTKPLVYIFDLAVKREFQRQGIGKNLISTINPYCKEAGVEEVFVQADLVDDYALDFYRSTGGIPEDVVHFTYPLN